MTPPMHRVALGAAACAALVAGCSGTSSSFAPGDGTLRFTATNDLVAPITIAVDDTPFVILVQGQSSAMAIPVNTRRLTWTSAKPTDVAGVAIPDEIPTVNVPVGSIRSVLEITNVIDGQTFFTGRLLNHTPAKVGIGVFDGATTACAAVLPGGTSTAPGFVLIGYYRLLSSTEVRAYRDTTCTGTFLAWPHTQIASPAEKSGSVTLTLDSAP